MSHPQNNADATCPAYDFQAITPSDTAVIRQTRGIYVGIGGDIKVQGLSGRSVTFVNVPGGTILPVQAEMVYSTGTVATDLIALF